MEPGVVVHICDSNTGEAEAGGQQVWGQSELHSKTMSQNTKNQTKTKNLEACLNAGV
jgi:hypothetical protein